MLYDHIPCLSLDVDVLKKGSICCHCLAPLHMTLLSSSLPQTVHRGGGAAAMDPFTLDVDVEAVRILDKCLGRGAFGAVHLGVHAETGQNVAVKCLSFPTCENRKAKRQLEESASEIRLMQSLHHPCVVQYLGAKRDGWDLFIFMEYISGGTLKTLIGNMGRLTPALGKKILTCVLLGLNYLHSLSICHRDVKCENILLTGDGRAKLGDFGTSKSIQDCFSLCSGLQSVVGTPWFMAPEVINGEQYGLPVDIWSVGCVCYEMMTGKHPYHEFNNLTAVMFHVARDRKPPTFPAELKAEHSAFMMCCFQGEPRDRMRTEELLEHVYLSGPSSTKSRAYPDVTPPADHPIRSTRLEVASPPAAPPSRPTSGKSGSSPHAAPARRDAYDDDPEVLNVTDDGVAVITLRSEAPTSTRIGLTGDGMGFIDPCAFGRGTAAPGDSRRLLHPQPPTPVASVVEDPVVAFNDSTPVPQRRSLVEVEPESPGFGALPCCQVCRKAIAVFMCDQCGSSEGRLSFCPGCWDVYHTAESHKKMPLLFNVGRQVAQTPKGTRQAAAEPSSPAFLMESGRCVDFATHLNREGCGGEHPGPCSYDNDGVCRYARDAPTQWACRYCTYLNASVLSECEVCERPR
eukprot:TRINITY_DN4898_c0_g3_i1.p1 TRINITY_DN4898_c0_g3~~TRINITY_DN4898_c0_g3_i1.p1  ORF type:complete len:628 (+),score=115.49 TRINITY_DN4898_c0_g3_i1:1148-3031(+)